MTDLDQWKEWLDKWQVTYYVEDSDNYRGEPTTEICMPGNYATAYIVFKKETNEFMYVTANE